MSGWSSRSPAIARRLDHGRVGAGLQRRCGTGWAERQTPAARFLPVGGETVRWPCSPPSAGVAVTADQFYGQLDRINPLYVVGHERRGDEAL